MSRRAKDVKRSTTFRGLPISIEIEVGETRSGVGLEGEKWSKTYDVAYGEVDKTLAPTDGDPVDVYLGPLAGDANRATPGLEARADLVFVVHQLRKDGSPDEDKVMLGFWDAMDAALAYRRHGPPWGFGTMDVMTWDQFVHGYLAANRAPEVGPETAGGREALGAARYGS